MVIVLRCPGPSSGVLRPVSDTGLELGRDDSLASGPTGIRSLAECLHSIRTTVYVSQRMCYGYGFDT